VSDAPIDPNADSNEEPKGKVDLVAVLYIVGGIPAMVAYFVISFVLSRWIDFPA